MPRSVRLSLSKRLSLSDTLKTAEKHCTMETSTDTDRQHKYLMDEYDQSILH